ncbi:MAG: hypothetical protein QXH37_09515, partial [Candidatus Bathyarchaeia archaeon]
SMFEDGLRFIAYLSKGVFPKITVSTGLASIREVAGKIRYPTSKNTLIKRIGWRLVELEDDKQVRLGTILATLPAKIFRNVDELVEEIKSIKKLSG